MSNAKSTYPANTIPSVRHVNVVPSKAPPHKFMEGIKDQDTVWDASHIARRELLFLRNCSGGSITVNAPFAKILIGTTSFSDSFSLSLSHYLCREVLL